MSEKYGPQKKYHKQHYGKLGASIKKDLLEEFAKACAERNVSQAQVLTEFMKEFIKTRKNEA